MEGKLKAILDSLTFFKSTYSEDTSLVLADTENVIGYIPGRTIDFKLTVGSPISNLKGTVLYKALELKQSFREERDSSQFGFSYVSTAEPIFENDQLIGVLGVVVSNKRIDVLRTMSANLAATVEEMAATSDQVASATHEVAGDITNLSHISEDVQAEISNIHTVLSFVQKISVQSQILGLNASIEAARAGESGRGFAVVAKEVQKMAEQSKSAAESIRGQLELIQVAIEKMSTSIEHIAANSQEHSASIEELNRAFQHIAEITDELSETASLN